MLLLVSVVSHAQTDTTRMSVRNFLVEQHIDTLWVNDTVSFRKHLENLTVSGSRCIDTCQKYVRQFSDAKSLLKRSGVVKDDMLWIDSASFYVDYKLYLSRMESCERIARGMKSYYQDKEQKRQEAERKAAEERARREAKMLQDSLNTQWAQLKSEVLDMHNQIEAICLAVGVEDKNRVKALKDLRYDYLPVYNRYDLTPEEGTSSNIERVARLQRFQRNLLDSILGPSGYPARIASFPATLKVRAGKSHVEVYKTYMRVFKTVVIPTSFGKLEDYRRFVQKLRDIETIQQGYLTAVTLREDIALNTVNISNLCMKRHKDVLEAYQLVLQGVNQQPVFTTIGEMDMFLGSLRSFIKVQGSYVESVSRLDAIALRGDSITGLCNKRTMDVAEGYRMLSSNTSFIPTFKTMDGADFFFNTLNDFEQLQQDYSLTASLRNSIADKADSIMRHKGAPKILVNSYKDMHERLVVAPTFNTHEKALLYIEQLEGVIQIQGYVRESEYLNDTIETNAQSMKARSKNASNIWKAYLILEEEAMTVSAIRNENDLVRYMSGQRQLIQIQKVLINILVGPDRNDYNNRLKGVKDTKKIKDVLGI